MSASLSLYRKYRSQNFDELVGQDPVVRTLKNAIASERIGHAYLFTGPRGVGKTSAARLLARAANCLSEGPNKPCNECANCLAAAHDIVTDLIEIDAASNTGVDNIRELIERAQFAPSVWHTKFYIIDEVHMLSVSAFNALLKTLEEPPSNVAFVLATTEVHKVPATVASRCQRFDFRRVPLSAMVARLRWICEQEGIVAEDAALELVARQATGSLRDALSLMDQLRVFATDGIKLADVQDLLGASGSEKVADFVDCLVAGDLAGGLRIVGSVAEDGLDVRQLNRQIVEHLRALMLVKSGATAGDSTLIDVTAEIRKRLSEQAGKVTIPSLLHWLTAFANADAALRTTSYRQLPLELALVTALTEPGTTEIAQRPPAPEVEARPADLPPFAAHRPATNGSARPEPRREEPAAKLPPPLHIAFAREEMPVDEADTPISASAEAPGSATLSTQMQGEVAEGQERDAEAPAEEQEGEPQDELARLKKLWPRLLEQINARSKNVWAVFHDPSQVRPYRVEGKNVTISFRYPIHAGRSKSDPARGIIEQALALTLGYPCMLEAITFAEEGGDSSEGTKRPAGQSKKPPQKSPAPHETPRGKAAMNIFGIDKFEDQ